MKTKLFVYLYLILLIFSPFVGYFSIKVLLNGPMNVFSALTILLFLIFLFEVFITKKKIRVPKYLWYYIAFSLYKIFSDVILVGKTINIKYLYSDYMITFALVIIMVENISLTKKNMKVLTFVMVVVVLAAFVTILLQQFYAPDFFINTSNITAFDFANMSNVDQQRLSSIYSWIGLLEVGFSFLPMLAILVDRALSNKKSQLWGWLMVGLVYSFLTRARWLMLNYLLILLIPFLFYRKNFKKIILNIIGISFVVVIALSVSDYFGAPVYGIIENRILEKSHGGLEQGSASTRILAFYVFGQLYPGHPIFGKGDFHTFNKTTDKDFALARALGGRSSQIHVGYLSLLYYYGIAGGLLFLLSLYYLMKRLYRRAKFTKHWASYIGILGFVLANFTLVNFSLFHAGLIIAIVFDRYYFLQKLNSRKIDKSLNGIAVK